MQLYHDTDNTNHLIDAIQSLKKKRNATILAHNYQCLEVQHCADMVGDSLELSRVISSIDSAVIVFCGVLFMAETAALLSPDKTILLPEINAGCPLADSISAYHLKLFKARYKNRPVVTYINSSAAVKAESDICCTSSNALSVVNSLPNDEIIFTPDKNLGSYIQQHTSKRLILWHGFCPVHNYVTDNEIMYKKQCFPHAKIIAHPESPDEVLQRADEITSTSGMLKILQHSDDKEYIICTELGLIEKMQYDFPEKTLIPASSKLFCYDMKRITLASVANALHNMQYAITVDANIAQHARNAISRMLEIHHESTV